MNSGTRKLDGGEGLGKYPSKPRPSKQLRDLRRQHAKFIKLSMQLKDSLDGKEGTMLIAGSAALIDLMFSDYCLKDPTFDTGDYDIFIGVDTKEKFDECIECVLTYWSQHNINWKELKRSTIYFGLLCTPILVVNYMVADFEAPISFIWYADISKREDIVARFDIDVCQVGYDFRAKEFVVSPSVHNSIKAMKATLVREWHFPDVIPDHNMNLSLHVSMLRMQKYHERGFHFTRPPVISFPSVSPK